MLDPIHLFRPVFRVEECLKEITECLGRGWTGMGFKTLEFEEAWKSYTKLPHAHFVNSCTSGLHLALKILTDGPGEAITTPLTFVSTNHAILHTGLTPRFVDVDEYLCLDPDKVHAAINSNTKAVVFVGMGGNPGRLSDIAEICQSSDIPLILDAAHMAGSRLDRRHVGHQSDASVFSFHSVKNLPTADAGMVCFLNSTHDARARRLSWMGITEDTYKRGGEDGYRWEYDVEELGFKYHGNSVMAALGLVGLRHLESDNERRREIARLYDDLLPPRVGRILMAPSSQSSRHLYQIVTEWRNELYEHMAANQIHCGVHYLDNRRYSVYDGHQDDCPAVDRVHKQVLSLPMHIKLSSDDVQRICETIEAFR